MHRILTNHDRVTHAALFEQMFRARAQVFHDRLGWEVQVTDGLEIDRYDHLEDVTYVVTLDDNGRVTGSLRLLPTTGPTMMKSDFNDFFNEPVDVESPTTLECTRFVVHPVDEEHPSEQRRVSSQLLIALCELCLSNGYDSILGLYNAGMTRVYRRIGWNPEPLAESHSDRGHLIVGIWEASEAALATMRSLAQGHDAVAPRRAA